MGNSKWLKLEKQPRSIFSKDLFHLSQREKQREWKRETRFYSYGFTCQITTSAQGLVSLKPRSGTNIWISLMDSSGPGTWLIFPRHGITELCWKQSSWPLNQAQTRHAGVVTYALYLLNHYAIPSLSLSSQCFAKMCTMKKISYIYSFSSRVDLCEYATKSTQWYQFGMSNPWEYELLRLAEPLADTARIIGGG